MRSTVGPLALLLLGGAATALAAGKMPPLSWRTTVSSPQPKTDPTLAPLYAICGEGDAALMDVALRSARRQAGGGAILPSDELAFHLRAAGDPHVWPRAWSIAGQGLDDADLARRLKRWVGGVTSVGRRRCGVARATTEDGGAVVSVVAVDALADLSPLPTVARVGQWLTLEGTMLVPATGATVILLGPRGAPRSNVASLSGGRLRSSFSVDRPGAWLVQVLATVDSGPRPVLEAIVFAGVDPPTAFMRAPAPGEEAGRGIQDDDDAMLKMVNAARASEGLPALTRDPTLERLARAHSATMRKAKMIGHDVGGGGDPRARLDAAGVRARLAGENVASAATLEGAHRALWASPSHRGNLLTPQFTRVGIAVVRDEGVVWVTELFAG